MAGATARMVAIEVSERPLMDTLMLRGFVGTPYLPTCMCRMSL